MKLEEYKTELVKKLEHWMELNKNNLNLNKNAEKIAYFNGKIDAYENVLILIKADLVGEL